MYGAVLMRYTIWNTDHELPVARVIKQAEFFDPKTTGVLGLNPTLVPDE